MAETLLPFQCNHVEKLWKNTNKKKRIQNLKERKWKKSNSSSLFIIFFFLTNSLDPDLKKVQNYLVLAEKRTVRTVHGFRNRAV